MVGEEAEDLVYHFCVIDREEMERLVSLLKNSAVRDTKSSVGAADGFPGPETHYI